ncbi:MAG: hypothetical protein ACT4QE_06880 [Anaerolineales bacterium]
MSLDVIGAFAGFFLTLFVLSYAIGDNPLYRIAVSLFVGAVAGYAVVVAFFNVLKPQLGDALLSALQAADTTRLLLVGVAWLLTLLLALKFFIPGSNLGRIPLAYLVGLGAAVAVGGAVSGTLFPQTSATFVSFGGGLEQLVEAVLLVIGTVSVLLYFHYGARAKASASAPNGFMRRVFGPDASRPIFIRPFARVGQVFIGIAFGVMFAGTLAASLAFLAERLGALITFVSTLNIQ